MLSTFPRFLSDKINGLPLLSDSMYLPLLRFLSGEGNIREEVSRSLVVLQCVSFRESRLFVQETSLYVPTFLILTIGCFLHNFLHILSDDCYKYYVPCYFQRILF